MYSDNSFKLILVVNRQLEAGRAMNAMCHAVAGLVASLTLGKGIEFLPYPSGAGWKSEISKAPVIVLRSDNTNHLARLHQDALREALPVNVFVHTMLGTSAKEQQQATLSADPTTLEYLAVAVFGASDELKPLTKRFSLYK
ncbi:MAG: DUF2000 domain-containing protein [Aquabacterium sp.]|uniref:DUF2000 domain-containing protein n=1 Tax=Aquabacterium sp. TaxID=1872578 RepID=UPI0025B90AF4|nr:DUF2000 domain-containing protein [Aquabacterium sp.]MBI5926710.1 DUF2000 domain-containing protein [Aquabacterium sp.]